jgi:hypothetical protein
MSSSLTIATTAWSADCPALACGFAAGAAVGAWLEGSAGLAERLISPDGALVAAGAVAVSAAVPNFGSAEAMLAVPARRRMAAVEARRRSIRTPGIANSPLSPAKGRKTLAWAGYLGFPTSSFLGSQSLI